MIYTGTNSKDGKQLNYDQGLFINPHNNNEWSSVPYPNQKKTMAANLAIEQYMGQEYTFKDVYEQIINKRCKLSFTLRTYFLSVYNSKE
jgi:hypothetical protein